jgi:hypothetical protein
MMKVLISLGRMQARQRVDPLQIITVELELNIGS